jgi:hypothetical protein
MFYNSVHFCPVPCLQERERARSDSLDVLVRLGEGGKLLCEMGWWYCIEENRRARSDSLRVCFHRLGGGGR